MTPPPLPGLELLAANGTQRQYRRGETLFSEGAVGNEMYVLLEGEIDITRQGSHIDLLQAPTILGEMALVDAGLRSASATAVTDLSVLAIRHDQFTAILREFPEFATDVMAIMTSRLRRLTRQEVQRQRMEHEMEIAHRIQLSLLPELTPQVSGWEFATYYRAAQQVGGDMFDFVQMSDDPANVTIFIADVTGKGVPAAMFMAVARTLLRAEGRKGHDPAPSLESVNETILADNRTPLFLSALCTRVDTRTGKMTFSSAGHESPVFLNHSSGNAQFLPVQGLVLGAFHGVRYHQDSLTLAPGDVVLQYTDGVTEARNRAGEFFGEERLLETVASARGKSAEGIVKHVVTAVSEYSEGVPQADDLTVLAFGPL